MNKTIALFFLLEGCSNIISEDPSSDETSSSALLNLQQEEPFEGLYLTTQREIPYVPSQVTAPEYQILSAYIDDHSRVTFVHTGNYVYKIRDHHPKSGFLSKDTPLENMLLCVSRDTIQHPYDEPFGENSNLIMEHGFIAECGASYPEEDTTFVVVLGKDDYDLAVAMYRDMLTHGITFDIPNPLCQ